MEIVHNRLFTLPGTAKRRAQVSYTFQVRAPSAVNRIRG